MRSRRTAEARRAEAPPSGRPMWGRSRALPFPVLPQDDGILTIAAGVAGTHAAGDEPEAAVQLNARRVGDAHLERVRSEEHTSELQSRFDLVCRLLLEK